MSALGGRDPTQEGQDGQVSPVGEWANVAREGDGMGRGSGADSGDAASVAREAQVVGPGVMEVVRPEEGPEEEEEEEEEEEGEEEDEEEEESEQSLVLVRSPDSGDAEEDSDFGLPEGASGYQAVRGYQAARAYQAASHNIFLEARQFPMVGFRFMFLDLMHSLLQRIYFNDHILIRSYYGRLIVQSLSPTRDGSGELPILHVPPRPRVMAAAMEGEGEGSGQRLVVSLPALAASSVGEAEEPTYSTAVTGDSVEGAEEAADDQTEKAVEKPAEEVAEKPVEEVAEKPAEEVTEKPAEQVAEQVSVLIGEESKKDKEAEEEKEKENKDQEEGPKKDPDPAEENPRKSSWKE